MFGSPHLFSTRLALGSEIIVFFPVELQVVWLAVEEVSRADAQIPKTALPVHQICAGCIYTVSIAHGVVLYLHCKYLYCVAIEVIRHIVQFLL